MKTTYNSPEFKELVHKVVNYIVNNFKSYDYSENEATKIVEEYLSPSEFEKQSNKPIKQLAEDAVICYGASFCGGYPQTYNDASLKQKRF